MIVVMVLFFKWIQQVTSLQLSEVLSCCGLICLMKYFYLLNDGVLLKTRIDRQLH